MITIGLKRLSIFCGVGPLGWSEFCPLFLASAAAGEDERDGEHEHATAAAKRSRRGLQLRDPHVSFQRRPATCAASTRSPSASSTLRHADFAVSNLCALVELSTRGGRGRGRGAASRARPSPWSRGTRGCRAAPRAPCARRVPASLSTAPPLPITMPFCDSRSTRITRPEPQDAVVGLVRSSAIAARSSSSSGSISSAITVIECGQLVAGHARAASRAAARRRGTSRAGR